MITAAAASPSNSARTAQTALEEDLQSNVALQQHVFLISLERLVGCLQNPSDRSRGLCEELGVPHGDLAEAIFRKKLQQGERQQQQAETGELGDGLEDKDKQEKGGVTAAYPPSDDSLVSILIQALSTAFFAQEVLSGERVLGHARAKLEPLWGKMVELTEERDKTFFRTKLSPEKQILCAALSRALEQQSGGDQGFVASKRGKDFLCAQGSARESLACSRAKQREPASGFLRPGQREGAKVPPELGLGFQAAQSQFFESRARTKADVPPVVRSPTTGSPMSRSPTSRSPTSRLRPPKAGRRLQHSPSASSLVNSPPQSGVLVQAAISSSLPSSPLQCRSFCPLPVVSSVCEMSDSRNGNGTDTSNNHGVLSPQAHVVAASGGNFGFNGIDLMERRGQQLTVAFAGGGDGVVDDNREIEARLRKEVEALRSQRDILTRSLSFVRGQCLDALGDSKMQINRFTEEVEILRCASDKLVQELAEESIERAKETALLTDEAATARHMAETATSQVEEAERAREGMRAEMARMDTEQVAVTNALGQKVLALETRSKFMAVQNLDLQDRLDATFSEMEEVQKSNTSLQAEVNTACSSERAPFSREAVLRAKADMDEDRLANGSRDPEAQLPHKWVDTESFCDLEQESATDAEDLQGMLAEAIAEKELLAGDLRKARAQALHLQEEAELFRGGELGAVTVAVARAQEAMSAPEGSHTLSGATSGVVTINPLAILAKTSTTCTTAAKQDASLTAVQKPEMEQELSTLKECVVRLTEERDQSVRAIRNNALEFVQEFEASREQMVTVVKERDVWAVRSGEWEDEASRLADALDISENKDAGLRGELKALLATTQCEFAEAQEDLANSRRLRDEERATAKEREAGLMKELETTQTIVSVLESEASKNSKCSQEAIAHYISDLAGMRGTLGATQDRLVEVETERDSALKSLGKVIELRKQPQQQHKEQQQPRCEKDCVETVDNGCDGVPDSPGCVGGMDNIGGIYIYDDSDGNSGARQNGGAKGGTEESQMLPGSDTDHIVHESKIFTSAYKDTLTMRRLAGNRGYGESKDANVQSSEETKTDSPEYMKASRSAFTTIGTTERENPKAWCLDGRGNKGQGEHVCSVCGTSAPTSRKLLDCRLSLGRMKVEVAKAHTRALEAAEETAAAAEDSMSSRHEKKALEASLAESVLELEAMRVESQRVSISAVKCETAARHKADETCARLAEVEAQLVEAEASLAREKMVSARFIPVPGTPPPECSPSVPGATTFPINCMKIDLETTEAALADCRTDLNQRSRQLDTLREQADADKTRAVVEVSASKEALAKAMCTIEETRKVCQESVREAREEKARQLDTLREQAEADRARAVAEGSASKEALAKSICTIEETRKTGQETASEAKEETVRQLNTLREQAEADKTRAVAEVSASKEALENAMCTIEETRKICQESVREARKEKAKELDTLRKQVEADRTRAEAEVSASKEALAKAMCTIEETRKICQEAASQAKEEKFRQLDTLREQAEADRARAKAEVSASKEALAKAMCTIKETQNTVQEAASKAKEEKVRQLDTLREQVEADKTRAVEEVSALEEALAKAMCTTEETRKTGQEAVREAKKDKTEQLDTLREQVEADRTRAAAEVSASKETLAKAMCTIEETRKTSQEAASQAREEKARQLDTLREQAEADRARAKAEVSASKEALAKAMCTIKETQNTAQEAASKAKEEKVRQLDTLREQVEADKTRAVAEVSALEEALAKAMCTTEETRKTGQEAVREAKKDKTEQLDTLREQVEADRTRAAAEVSASKEALAKAMCTIEEIRKTSQEAGHEMRETKAAAVVSMDAALAKMTNAAAEQARGCYVTFEQEKGVLREECAGLRARLEEMKEAKLEKDALVKQTEEAKMVQDEAFFKLKKDLASYRGQMDSLLAAIHEPCERRQATANDAAATAAAITELNSERRQAAFRDREATSGLEQAAAAHRAELQEAREAARAENRLVEARVLEKAEAAASSSMSATKRELEGLTKTTAAREGEIAALQARLRAAEEETGSTRREALLEGRAKSLVEVTAAIKQVAEACAEAEVLRERCNQQEKTISDLAFSREEEADACRISRTSLADERSALASSEERIRELQLEVDRLSSHLEQASSAKEAARFSGDGADLFRSNTGPFPKDDGGSARGQAADGDPSAYRNGIDIKNDRSFRIPQNQERGHLYTGRHITENPAANLRTSWDTRQQAESFDAANFRVGARESIEREKARRFVFSLEEAMHAAGEESKQLKLRVHRLRAGLREAERRGDEMEVAASASRAAVETKEKEVEAATAEVKTAMVIRREAEQKVLATERREDERTSALEAEVFRLMAAGREVQEGYVLARSELSRLGTALEESDRRVATLEDNLMVSTTNLLAAEAGKARALMNVVRVLGRGNEEGGRGDRRDSSRGRAWALRMGLVSDVAKPGVLEDPSGRLQSTEFATVTPPPPKTTPPGQRLLFPADCSYETIALRERLVASHAQHEELVRTTEEAVTRCIRHCEARVRAVLAAGTLTSACCRWRGILAGREAALEAAGRVALVRRCFRALREEALLKSRDRSVRRQERIQRWIGEAVERAGEEIMSIATTGSRTAGANGVL